MDNKGSESGHLMLITPERVFYSGLLGRPRERCPGAFHVYVAIRDGLQLTTAEGVTVHDELVVTMPDLRHTITSEYRAAICVAIEPESVSAGALEAWASRLPGPDRASFARRIRAAYEHLLNRQGRHDIDSAAFDTMCFGEPLPHRTLDPRVVKAIAQIQTFCGEPVTAASCAARAGLSASRFLHLFKQETGISFRSFRALEARTAFAAFCQPGPQLGASGAGHRLSRLDAFFALDPAVLRPETAGDLLRFTRSRNFTAAVPRRPQIASGRKKPAEAGAHDRGTSRQSR